MASEDLKTPTKDAVREVLRQVAASDRIREDHADVVDIVDESTLDTIADLAWRHQFSEDRSEFRKALGALQTYVAMTRQSDG